MATRGKIKAEDLFEKKIVIVAEQIEQALKELSAAEKQLAQDTAALGKIQNKTSKEAIKRQEKVTTGTKKVLGLKQKEVNLNIKLLGTQDRLIKMRKKEASMMGSLTKQWSKFQATVMKAVAAYAAIMVFVNSLNRLKQTVIILDSFTQLMEKVTGTTWDAAESLDYLIQMSKDYGISLDSAIQRYSKFFAAAVQANLTTEETRKIFSSMSKTAGILGLRAEEVTGVFLALEQMLSKGKVTTEELRRQLGERLPGAFGIMARAVGVSTRELDVMLKKGEIISRDVLPKFAEEMEKAFGIQSVEHIDTLIASVERANTAYIDLIRTVEDDGNISDVIKDTYDKWTQYLEILTEAIKDARSENLKWYESWLLIAAGAVGLSPFLQNTAGLSEDESERRERQQAIEQWAVLVKAAVEDSKELTLEQKDRLTLTVLEEKAAHMQTNALKEQVVIMKGINQENIEMAKLTEGTVVWYQAMIKKQDEFLKEKVTIGEANSEEAKHARHMIKEYQKMIDIILGKDGGGKKWTDGPLGIVGELGPKEGSIEWYNDRIKDLETHLKGLTEEELKRAVVMKEEVFMLKQQRDYLEEMVDFVEEIREDDDGFDPGIAVGDQLRKNKDPQRGQLGLGSLFETGKRLQDWADEFKALDEETRGTWDNFLKAKQGDVDAMVEMGIDLANELFEIGNQLFERALENINAEIEATEKKYDRLHDLAEGDQQAQKEIARAKAKDMEELEKKELAIRQRQAKYNKLQSIFNIIISTASGVMAASPIIPLMILIAAMGAASLATVAAAPIPQYRAGRKGGKAEWAITGDGGQSEYITGKSGTRKTPSKPTLTYLEEGDTVHRNEKAYKEMLRRSTYQAMDKRSHADFDGAIERGMAKAKINNYMKLQPRIEVKIGHEMWKHSNSQFGM